MERSKKSMRIAVIGATGRLGSAIAREALARGHSVTAISPNASNFDHVPGLEKAARVVADLTDQASIRRAIAGHDAVVAAVRDKNLGPERHFLRDAAQTLLAALSEANVNRLLFL